jgi:hypothetical protein
MAHVIGVLVLLAAASNATLLAQNPSPSPPLESPTSTQPAEAEQPQVYRTIQSRIAIGRSITVARDEEVTDAVVVIGGNAHVEGRVRDGLVVVGGSAELGPAADVGGDVVVVGGRLNRAPGARLHGTVSDISIGEWAPWQFGNWYIPAFDFGDFGRWIALFGALFRVSFLAMIMAVLLLVARAPVARVGHAAAAAPGRAFLAGLAAEILFVPALIAACIALAITIIGIPLVVVLVPVAILTAAVAMALGFTALATRVGEWLEDRLGWRGHNAFLAAAVGLIIIVGPTLLARILGVAPGIGIAGFFLLMTGVVVEFVVWTIGLGATLMTGFGRWSTVPPAVPPPPPSPLPVVVNV